jgi:hypothetical protein
MIIPKKMPNEIIAKVLGCYPADVYDHSDYQAIAKHLRTYQSNGAEWEDYRLRMREQLDIWADILKRCRDQGFVYGGVRSIIRQERIFWMQRVEYRLPEMDRKVDIK